MSDFLTNLVMRSFAQAPSVQPMTLSTYAAPEPQIETDPVETAPAETAPAETAPVEHVTEPVEVRSPEQRELMMKDAPLAETRPSSPEHFEKNPELQLHHEDMTQKSVVLEAPRAMSEPDQTIASPATPAQLPQQHIAKPVVQVQKAAEPLIVEQVIENVVERPTVKSIERPTVRTIEHPTNTIIERPTHTTIERPTHTTIERPTIRTIQRPTITTVEQSSIETIDRPSITSVERRSIERSIEQSSITIENTEHVTNSFTTLVPKVTPQSLPALSPKQRGAAPPPETTIEEQQQTPTASPETVINVAIGRIEVRATAAPAPRRERAQGPKVMTLDDYVQQRSRGAQ